MSYSLKWPIAIRPRVTEYSIQIYRTDEYEWRWRITGPPYGPEGGQEWTSTSHMPNQNQALAWANATLRGILTSEDYH